MRRTIVGYLLILLSLESCLVNCLFTPICPKDEELAPCYCDHFSRAISCNVPGSRVQSINEVTKKISDSVGNRTETFEFLAQGVNIGSEVSEDAFAQLLLEKVAIIWTGITRIHPNAFQATKDVTIYVDLQANNLREDIFLTLATLNNLQFLNLADNRIQTIPDYAFKKTSGDYHSKLELVFLKSNRIHFISDHAFFDLPRLTTLDLQANNLTTLSDKSLAFKQVPHSENKPLEIDLSENQLSEASVSTLAGLLVPRPVILILARNNFTHLKEEVFKPFLHQNPRNEVDVYKNPLECSCPAKWLHKRRGHLQKRVKGHKCLDDRYLWELTSDHFEQCED